MQVTFRNVTWGRCKYVSVALHFVTFHIMTNMKLYGGYASNVSQRFKYVSVALHFVTFHNMTNINLYGGYASNVSQR